MNFKSRGRETDPSWISISTPPPERWQGGNHHHIHTYSYRVRNYDRHYRSVVVCEVRATLRVPGVVRASERTSPFPCKREIPEHYPGPLRTISAQHAVPR